MRRSLTARALVVAAALALFLLLLPQHAFAQGGAVEPDAVPGFVPFGPVQSLSAGEEGNCVVTPARTLFCWGAGFQGQNGTGTNDNKITPAPVTSLSNVLSVNRSSNHTCAVVQGGSLHCWGFNGSGQLGNGSSDPSPAPVAATIDNVASVAAGGEFTCARKTNGEIWCWGDNTYGQLGKGDEGGASPTPVHTNTITNAVALDSGTFHTCALLATGKVRCWGNSSNGQVGSGAFSSAISSPAEVLLPEAVVQITAGGTTTCARTAAGKVYCWGDNVAGQLGTANIGVDQHTPIAPQSLETAIAGIDTNSSSTCAWTTTGLAYCWGSNIAGMLGGGTGPDGADKISVLGLPAQVRSLAVGAFHVCAILIDNRVVCWGSNQGNALGNGTNLSSLYSDFVRTPSTCFQLNLARTGNGSLPVQSPTNSIGCPIGHYVSGTLITLSALPNAQDRVHTWSSPVSFMAGDTGALLSMPGADTTVTVTYAACHLLTRTHTGNGANPVPSFSNSNGCAAGRYAPSEVILVAATPSTNQRVQAWSGTVIAPGLGLAVNSVVMPNADATVNVTYQPCNLLTVSAVGNGSAPGVFPAASAGCPAGTYVAGEAIVLTAAPARGWGVGVWSGTADDSSRALTNGLTMPARDASVRMEYFAVISLPLVLAR